MKLNQERIYLLFAMFWQKFRATIWNSSLPNEGNILVVKTDDIGDLVYALSSIANIAFANPNCKVVVVVKPICKALLLNLCISFSNIEVQTNIPSYKWKYIVALRGNFSLLWFGLCNPKIPFISKAPIRWKYMGQLIHDENINLECIKPLIETPKEMQLSKLMHCEWQKPKENSPKIAIHVGGNAELRRWKIKNFISVIDYLITQRQASVYLIGGNDDKINNTEILTYFTNKDSNIVDMSSKMDLGELCTFFSSCDLMLGNESGPLHIAALTGCPTVGLFGPGVPSVFYPKSKNTHIIHHVLTCNPCNQKKCISPQYTCMDRIEIQDVIEKINLILR